MTTTRRRRPHRPGRTHSRRSTRPWTSCTDEAQQLGGAAGTALEGACTAVGTEANQAIDAGGENVEQALSNAEKSCKSAVNQLPSGQAQDALTQLCDAIASAE